MLLGSGAASAVTLVIGLTAWTSISTLGKRVQKIGDVQAKKLYLTGEINAVTSDIVAEERGIALRTFRKDSAGITKYDRDFEQSFGLLKKSVDEFIPLIENVAEKQAIEDIQNAQSSILQSHQKLMQLALGGNPDAVAGFVDDQVLRLVMKISDEGSQLAQQQSGLMVAVTEAATSSVNQNGWMIALLLCAALVICAFVMFTVRQSIEDLRRILGQLLQGSEQVADASAQISSSSQSLAQGASEQAASLEETSASTAQIGSMTRRNSENSKLSADLVTQSVQKFEESNHLLQQAVSAMGEISNSSERIAKIIKVIDEIAFQTNILALNAAVEAARAGEAGMGFSVVADEVRNLAQRCAQAAKDTELLIEESIAKSRDGKTMVDQTADAIQAISAQSIQMKTLADEVNLGSQDQLRGVDQIAKAISQMEKITQTTAANAEEGAAAAEELNHQSASLQQVVVHLGLLLGSSSSKPQRSAQVQNKAVQNKAAAKPAAAKSDVSALKISNTEKPVKKAEKEIMLPSLDYSEFPLEESFKEF